MHGRDGEVWKRRRRHMCSVPASPVAAQSPSLSPLPPSDSLIQSSVDSFLKDGRKFRVGDCALFQAGNAPPFIGIIRWFSTGKEDCLKLCVNWLYRPADVKLAKGILLEAAPNELFYSFHKDVISAASLLHPCKVAFLRKGVELPPGISSFVCRRVYDIANKCLWWLTDQDYINERQEEVDQLLDKTRLEMHAGVPSGGRSPKPLNGPTSTQQLKSVTDSIPNSGSSLPSPSKGRKRGRGGDQGTETIKRERPTKPEDGEIASARLENMIKAEFAKITEKGALTSTESVEKLVHLMQLDRNERKIDLAGRLLVADVIAATDKIECLGRFVQLRGVPVLDEWLQEAHKGKSGDGSSPKESDKGVDELLIGLLRALDKLPVNLNALQTCNIGKSVNHLRSHKNLEIQKKARSLVDTWKKRVDAEMAMINDAKSQGSTRASITQTSACKTLAGKPVHSDAIVKSTISTLGNLKLPSFLPVSMSISSKDSPGKGAGSSGNSELPLATVKVEKSSSSSQSQNNSQSCSSDQAKDARSSTAGSRKTKTKRSSRHRRSSNGILGCSSGAQKEANLAKTGSHKDKVSIHSGLSSERPGDMPSSDHGSSHRLIVRLPNQGRSPARSASGGSLEDPSIDPDKHDHIDRKIKVKSDACRSHTSTDVNAESWQSNDVKEGLVGSDEGDRSPAAVLDGADETGRIVDVCRASCSSSVNGKGASVIGSKSRNSFSSMNALIESCAKYSEASTSLSAGDDIGINLLANVAAGEISKLDSVSPSGSPGSSPKEEPSASNNEARSRLSCENGLDQKRGQSDENADNDSLKQGKIVGPVLANDKLQETSMRRQKLRSEKSGEYSVKPEFKSVEERADKCSSISTPANMKEEGIGAHQSAVDDKKPIDYTCEKIAEGSTKASDLAGNSSSNVCDSKTEKLVVEGSLLCTPSADQKKPHVTEDHAEETERIGNDAIPSSAIDKIPYSEITEMCMTKKPDESEDKKLDLGDGASKEQGGLGPSSESAGSVAVSLGTSTRVDEISERKGTLENSAVSDIPKPPSDVPAQESEKCAKFIESKLKEEIAFSAPDPDTGPKLDFDLNEGFSVDDTNQSDHLISTAAVSSPAIPLPTQSPFTNSISNTLHAPITVAAPAKGPFVPPENLLSSKGELGWKGSAATSAFRPAEPRKVLEMPLITSEVNKPGRPLLDFDLNVPDDRVLEDTASQNSLQTAGSESGAISNRSAGGLDLDLNKADEGTDTGQFLASTSGRLEVPLMSVKPARGGFSNGEASTFRDFDLNNGPGLDEAGSEAHPKSQHAKNSNKMPFLPPLSGLRMSNAELGNVSSWFPPGNSYPTVAIPSFLSDRGDNQPFPIVAAPGTQRILGSVTGAGPFGGDLYRGQVLSSSPMAFPQATAFPYPGIPFGSSFPLTSTSFLGASTTYVDSSSFPTVPSQLMGTAGAVSSHFVRPYMVSLQEGSNNAGSESSRRWARQGLDLNTGPGSGDADAKDERRASSSRQLPIGSSHAFLEEQSRIYQVSGGGMKRKERDGDSWDERFYKQPSWK